MFRCCFNGYVIEVLDKRDRLFNVKFGFIFRFYECYDIEGVFCVIIMMKIFLDLDGVYCFLVFILKGFNILWVII